MEESAEAAKAFHQVLAILYLLSFMWAILLTPSMKRLGFLIGAIDRPDDPRKVHTRIIARFGGPGVFLAFFLALAALPFIGVGTRQIFWENSIHLLGLFVAAGMVLTAGIYDDVRGLHGRYKFLIIMIASVVLWQAGFRIDKIYIPIFGLGETELVWWISVPLTVLWVTLCTAALNLIDGLDGLATGVTLIASITLLWLGWGSPDRLWETMVTCCLIGSVVGFLIFNFHPAKIFLGDSGALFLGFMVGAISVKSSFKSTTMATLIVPIMVLGLPILDTTMVIVSRWARRVPIFNPDRMHLHHRLMDQWGLKQRSAVFVFYAVSILFGGGALVVSWQRGQWRWLPIAGIALVVVILLTLLRCQEVAIAVVRLVNTLIRRNGPPRHWMERAHIFNSLEQADSIVGIWQCCTEVMSEYQVQYGGLKLDPGTFREQAGHSQLSWEWNGPPELDKAHEPGGARWSAIYELQDHGRKLGVFYLERNVIGDMSIQGLGEVANKLIDCLTASLSRLSSDPTPTDSDPDPAPRQT